jgi:ZIP family zinc transporter/zinc and cadmium transporter
MSNPLLISLFFGLLAALANIFGGLVIIQTHWRKEYLKYFLALGSGFMLAAAFLEMVPESFALHQQELWGTPIPALCILGGYLLVHLFEHGFAPHFHFGEEVHCHEMLNPRVGFSALIGLISHTFFDGVAIASGFIVSFQLGIILFLAVILHKIPEGFTVSSIMMASGKSKGVSLMAAVLLGVATLAGVFTMGVIQKLVYIGLPLSAGVTIYVAASDLMPEVNEEPGVQQSLYVFAGILLFILTRALLRTFEG